MTEKQQNNNPFTRPTKGGDNLKFNPYWIYGVIILVFIGIFFINSSEETKKISWHKFEKIAKAHDIEKVVIIRDKDFAKIFIKKDFIPSKYPELESKNRLSQTDTFFVYVFGTLENTELDLQRVLNEIPDEQKFNIEYESDPEWFTGLLSFLPFILLIGIWIYIMRRMSRGPGDGAGGGIFSVGKSKAKLFDKESKINVTFKDVAGLEEGKQEIEEIVEFLKHPDRYTKLGGKIPKGVLLVGPPGTGKTLLAKAVAGEANVPFFSMSGSDFVEMFVGVGASRVRDLFKQAKEKSPCIIFIDEIDAIGRARGKNPNMGSNDERENTLNQLLTEMDGFDTNSGVILLAATNRADILDKALMRAGRFDRQIQVDLPNLTERKEIFNVHLKPLKLNADVKSSFLAKQTPGFSGADIANVCNEAALIAARKSKEEVSKQDFLDAVDRIIGGLEKKSKIITDKEKRTIAYHEAGHATVSWILPNAHPLIKVTIVPRGKALGAAWYLPEERQITTTEQMLDEMCATLGGRAAEELRFGKISTGAQNDLEKVTKQAYAMTAIYGMSDELGHISYYDSTGQSDYAMTKPYSEKTAEKIDSEVKRIISQSYERAKEILTKHQEGHHKLAELLLEKEVIFSDDLEEIFGKREHEVQPDSLKPETTESEA